MSDELTEMITEDFSFLNYSVDTNVATITINRP